MARIIASTNVAIDGGFRDPTGEEGAPGGGWFGRIGPADRDAFGRAALEEAGAADAFLMGRRTYEFLVSRWPARTGALADRLAGLEKYVVSTSLRDPGWANTSVIREAPVPAIRTLQDRIGGDIVIPASFQLVRTLLESDLVDELRFIVFPFVLGTGESGYGRLPASARLQLLDHRRLGEHLTYTAYRVDRPCVDHGISALLRRSKGPGAHDQHEKGAGAAAAVDHRRHTSGHTELPERPDGVSVRSTV